MGVISKISDSEPWEAPPAGWSVAVVCDAVDLGLRNQGFGEKHYVEIRWQLPYRNARNERLIVRRRYVNSLHAKAWLRKHVELMLGRELTEGELRGFDLETLIGLSVNIDIRLHTKEDRVYADAYDVAPLGDSHEGLEVDPAYVREAARRR
jgi:hypothetical protein